MSNRVRIASTVVVFFLAATLAHAQAPVGTAFSYQGRLTDAGGPANGVYDLRLILFDAAGGVSQVGPTVTVEDVVVTDGLFQVDVDFGSGTFVGSARWLELGVRPGASTGAFAVLSPRQELTPAPNALFSQAAPWTGVSGKPPGFADDVDNDSGGDITDVTAGAGLTGGGSAGSVTLGVLFAGSGAANTASRTDHDHFGASWSGSATSGLQVSNGAAFGQAIYGSSTSSAGLAYGVRGGISGTGGAGVLGQAPSASGTTFGVQGESASTDGTGVYGVATATSGGGAGVKGETSSTAGDGVFGRAQSTTGVSIGVRGDSASTLGRGVFGFAFAPTGTASGVFGQASSSAGYGGFFTNTGGGAALRLGAGALVFADGTTQATAATNPAADITGVVASTGLLGGGTSGDVSLSVSFAGTGAAATVSRSDHDHFGASWSGSSANGLTITTTNGAAGRALYGEATATAGINWGVWGQTGSSEGRALYGRATSSLGNNYGVFGETASATGTAVFGLSTRTTGLNYGVRGETASIQGRGVYGLATATTGTTYGVYGQSSTSDGAGVQGVGQQYGVVGQTTSTTGFGFYTTNRGSFGAINVTGGVGGLTPSFLESQDVPVVLVNRGGSDGTLVNFARSNVIQGNISVAAGVVSYNAFTGSHYAWADAPIESGLLVSLNGRNLRLHDRQDGEPVYGVSPSDRDNDPRVLGAYLGRLEPGLPADPATENPHLVVAVGNGSLWVVDTGEDIEPGDRLVSSAIRGHARRDGGDLAVSYVVGRAAETIHWDDVDESIGGVKHRLISVLFEPGAIERAGGLRQRIADQGAEILELRARLAAIEARLLRD